VQSTGSSVLTFLKTGNWVFDGRFFTSKSFALSHFFVQGKGNKLPKMPSVLRRLFPLRKTPFLTFLNNFFLPIN
jgi:hypothetical protein